MTASAPVVTDPAAAHLLTLVLNAGGRMWSPAARATMGTSAARHEALVDRAGLHRDAGWLCVETPKVGRLPSRSPFPSERLPPPVRPSAPPAISSPANTGCAAASAVGPEQVRKPSPAPAPTVVANPPRPEVPPSEHADGTTAGVLPRKVKAPRASRPPRAPVPRLSATEAKEARGAFRRAEGEAKRAAMLAELDRAGRDGRTFAELGIAAGTSTSATSRFVRQLREAGLVVVLGRTINARVWLTGLEPRRWRPRERRHVEAQQQAVVEALRPGPMPAAELAQRLGLSPSRTRAIALSVGAESFREGREHYWRMP